MSDDDSGFLKRIGIPASLVALVSTAVTISAFVFTVDSRYAKADDIDTANSKLEQKVDALTAEVSRLAGVTHVLTQVAGRIENSRMQASEAEPAVNMEYDSTLPMESMPRLKRRFGARPNLVASAPTLPPPPMPAPVEVEKVKPIASENSTPDVPLQVLLENPPAIDEFDPDKASSSDVQRILRQSSEALTTSSQNLRKISEF